MTYVILCHISYSVFTTKQKQTKNKRKKKTKKKPNRNLGM